LIFISCQEALQALETFVVWKHLFFILSSQCCSYFTNFLHSSSSLWVCMFSNLLVIQLKPMSWCKLLNVQNFMLL